MPAVLVESVDGIAVRTSLEHMDFNRTKWLDLENPSDDELTSVGRIVGLSKHELHGFLDRDELPRVSRLGNFSVIVFRSPVQRANHTHSSTSSITLFLSERLLITIHEDPLPSLQGVLDLPEEELGEHLEKGLYELFYYLLERITNRFFVKLDDVEEQINKIEDVVFSRPDQRTVKRIFSLKRMLVYFHKSLSADRDVLISLQKGSDIYLPEPVQHRMVHLYYDVIQMLDMVATYRDILTGALDIYLSAVSNNMNAVMKKMAAYGTLVLVPTFLTGLYGMNFRFMPELNWRFGYAFAWFLILGSIVALWWYFKQKDWF